MAIVLIEGFDTYNGISNTLTAVGLQSRWSGAGAGVNGPTMVTGRFGGQAVSLYGASGDLFPIYIGLPGSYTSGTVGLAVYPLGLTFYSYPSFFSVGQGTAARASSQVYITTDASGSISVYRGGGTPTLLGTTATSVLQTNVWQYIEMEYVISSTVGSVNLYVNGANVLSLTGVNTQGQATNTVTTLFLQGSYSNRAYFDDLYVTDTATRLGEQRVATVVPTSDGTPSQWAASGGAVAPYTMVDEAQCNGDTDYIYDGTLGDRAVFNMASTGATPLSVSAVQIGTFSRKTDTGSRSIELQYVDGGGTAYSSSGIILGSSYARQLSLLQTNPATSTAWTPSEANALTTGVRVSV